MHSFPPTLSQPFIHTQSINITSRPALSRPPLSLPRLLFELSIDLNLIQLVFQLILVLCLVAAHFSETTLLLVEKPDCGGWHSPKPDAAGPPILTIDCQAIC